MKQSKTASKQEDKERQGITSGRRVSDILENEAIGSKAAFDTNR